MLRVVLDTNHFVGRICESASLRILNLESRRCGSAVPFICLWERHSRYFALSETLFRHLKKPQVKGITSVITLIEACVHPQRQGRLDLVQALCCQFANCYEKAAVRSPPFVLHINPLLDCGHCHASCGSLPEPVLTFDSLCGIKDCKY